MEMEEVASVAHPHQIVSNVTDKRQISLNLMLIFALSGLELPIGERADCGLSDRLLQRGLLQNLRLQQVTTSLQTKANLYK